MIQNNLSKKVLIMLALIIPATTRAISLNKVMNQANQIKWVVAAGLYGCATISLLVCLDNNNYTNKKLNSVLQGASLWTGLATVYCVCKAYDDFKSSKKIIKKQKI